MNYIKKISRTVLFVFPLLFLSMVFSNPAQAWYGYGHRTGGTTVHHNGYGNRGTTVHHNPVGGLNGHGTTVNHHYYR